MQATRYFAALLSTVTFALTACGGGGDSSAPVGSPPPASPPVTPPTPAAPAIVAPAAPVVALSYNIKRLQFSWPAVNDVTHYRLFERPDAAAAFAQVGADFTTTSVNHDIALHRRVNASYRIDACNGVGCTASDPISLAANLLPAIGYVKASNTGSDDRFGGAVALSADGTTLAIGSPNERSNATGINGNQLDDSAALAGAVYVFTRAAAGWSQQAYLKASNTDSGDQFGFDVALSADGSTLVATAIGENSNAAAINGDQLNNAAIDAGAAYVFVRIGTAWSQQAYIKASTPSIGDEFGRSVALSADGNTLVVGSPGEDTIGPEAGAALVFARSAGAWSQQAYLGASTPSHGAQFGVEVAISADGTTLAVGATRENSNATGINGNQLNMSAPGSGAVYVFTRSGNAWLQQAYIKASNTGADDNFGRSIGLSDNGSTLAVGAINEDNAVTGINGNQVNEIVQAVESGAVYVFMRTAGVWTQMAYIKASNTGANDRFGWALALSGDGATLAVGAREEGSSATGVNGGQLDNVASGAGAVYTFVRSGAVWAQQAYVKASNTQGTDQFGVAVAISADGATLAVGAALEDSSAVGIGSSQMDNSASSAGAVYLY